MDGCMKFGQTILEIYIRTAHFVMDERRMTTTDAAHHLGQNAIRFCLKKLCNSEIGPNILLLCTENIVIYTHE